MEAKLKEYRALRRRKELIEKTKDKLKQTKEKVVASFGVLNFFRKMTKAKDEEDEEEEVLLDIPEENEYFQKELEPEETEIEPVEEPEEESWRYCLTKWSIYLITWATLFFIFIQLQFGAVYFTISLLLGIYFNTRTRPRKKGEASAYSVFNKNCESIDGTLKAEDLQKQMLYGPVGML